MIKFIERPNQVLCNKIAEAVFGDKHKASFSEQFVPIQGHVPNPKMSNFSLFLNSSNCKFLWAILDPQDHEVVVGFILIADMPQNHSIGVGIDVNYANKGLMYNAMQEVMIDITSKGIRFPRNLTIKVTLN